MRATSQRRRSEPFGSRYRGAPAAALTRDHRTPHLAPLGEGRDCPDCGAHVKVNPSGSLKCHSVGGRPVSLRKGHPACPSSGYLASKGLA